MQRYTHPSWGSVLSDLALGLVGTDGWTVGVWAAITRKSKGTHAQVHTFSHTHTHTHTHRGTNTQRITGSPRLGQKVANIQTDRLKCMQRSLPRSVSHIDTRTHTLTFARTHTSANPQSHAYLFTCKHALGPKHGLSFSHADTHTHTRTHAHTQDY